MPDTPFDPLVLTALDGARSATPAQDAGTALGDRLRATEARLPVPADGEPRRTTSEEWRAHWR